MRNLGIKRFVLPFGSVSTFLCVSRNIKQRFIAAFSFMVGKLYDNSINVLLLCTFISNLTSVSYCRKQ